MTSLEMNVVISRKKNETHCSTQFSIAKETETKKKPRDLIVWIQGFILAMFLH